MANAKNYTSFSWSNQMINEKLVKSVNVRIFKPREEVISTPYLQLIDTDGKVDRKTSRSLKEHISNYSYVILSTSIFEKIHLHSENTYILFIKLYITSEFDISMLQNVDFLGKSYLLDAWKQFEDNNKNFDLQPIQKAEPSLSDMMNYSRKKVGPEYENLYSALETYAQAHHFDVVNQLFKKYSISAKYQALFWKEMYEKATTNQK